MKGMRRFKFYRVIAGIAGLVAGVAISVPTRAEPPSIALYSACIRVGSCEKNSDALCNVCPFPVVAMVCYARDNWGCRLTPDRKPVGPNQSTGFHAWYSDAYVAACRASDEYCVGLIDSIATSSLICQNNQRCSTGHGVYPDMYFKRTPRSIVEVTAIRP